MSKRKPARDELLIEDHELKKERLNLGNVVQAVSASTKE